MNFSNPVNDGVSASSVIPGFIFFVVGVVLVAAVIIFLLSLANRGSSEPNSHRQRPPNHRLDATDTGLAAGILYTTASGVEATEPSFTPPEIAGGVDTHHHSSGYEHEHGHSHGHADSGSGGSFDSGSSSSDGGSSGGGSDGGGGGSSGGGG